MCIQFKTMGRNALCGEFLHQGGEMDTLFRGEHEFCTHLFRGELLFMLLELFVSPGFALCFALFPMVSSPFASP
jgi:hypothetical protein